MSIHRYPLPSLLSDGFRAVFGIVVTLGPVLFLDVARLLAVILGVLGVVFFFFGFRVLVQGLSSIELTDRGISMHGPIGRGLAWRDMKALKLAHYAPPRRSPRGWYQLTLTGGSGPLKLESTIDGFDDIILAALEAAQAGGLALDPATGDNLRVLGHAKSART